LPGTVVGSSATLWLPGEGEIWGRTPSQNMQLQVAAATWRIETRSWMDLPLPAIPPFIKLLWSLLLLGEIASCSASDAAYCDISP